MRLSKLYRYSALIVAYTALQGPFAYGGGPDPLVQYQTRLSACSNALQAAQGLIDAQDASITQLKAANQELANRLADSQSSQLLPGWAWVTIGAAVGTISTVLIVRH